MSMGTLISDDEIFYTPFEPLQTHRFIMYIEGIPAFLIKAAKRPSLSNDVVNLDHINVRRKVKGKTSWQDINITLYDPIVPSGTQAVQEWIRLHHEAPTGRDGYSDFYKKDIVLNSLGPVGDKVQEWKIFGAFIVSVEYGQFNWESSGAMNIELTLSYDWALLNY